MKTWASVEVTETWRGSLPPRVEVRGGPKVRRLKHKGVTLIGISSSSRRYRIGQDYLFVPDERVRDAVMRENDCSLTQKLTPRVLRLVEAVLEREDQPSAANRTNSIFPFLLMSLVASASLAGLLAAKSRDDKDVPPSSDI